MRPEQFSSGNLVLEGIELTVLEASMRPEQFSSGNHCGRVRTVPALIALQ